MSFFTHIPYWVYLILAYIVWVGIKSSKTSTIPITKLIAIPLLFSYFSYNDLTNLFHVHTVNMMSGIWALSIVIGAAFGYHMVISKPIRADRTRKLIELQGDWSILILGLSIFVIKFWINYTIDANLPMSHQVYFMPLALAISGFIAGFSLGRNGTYYLKYSQAESVTLSES